MNEAGFEITQEMSPESNALDAVKILQLKFIGGRPQMTIHIVDTSREVISMILYMSKK